MEACVPTVTAAPTDHVPATGADLCGWSALPLLAGAKDHAGGWLFVAARSRASISAGPLPEAQFTETAADYGHAWPFAEAALDGVVIDGGALADGRDDAALQRLIGEASRVTGGSGNVLVVCGHRFVPRRLRAWREYGRRSAIRWQRAAASAGLHARTVGFLRFDGERVTDVTMPADERRGDGRLRRDADRLALRITAAGDREGAGTIGALVAEASRRCGVRLHIDRIAVRKIGKTAVFVTGADGQRYILRIARSPVALARATRNFETLEWLRGTSLPDVVQARAPSAVVRGTHAGYAYFMETCLHGRSGPLRGRRKARAGGWEMEAVHYVSALHGATARRVRMDASTMTAVVHEPAARLARACASSAADAILARLTGVCEAGLAGRVMPLVRTHVDFTESNCLFDAGGTLTAVVDWEVSAPQGLPLLDLLQLMPIPSESGSHPRWQRFEAWLDLARAPERVLSDPVMGDYMRALDVPPASVPAIVLTQWITHVADRIEARRDDERWMRLRLRQPLESLGRMLE